jgi:hypothetical protein
MGREVERPRTAPTNLPGCKRRPGPSARTCQRNRLDAGISTWQPNDRGRGAATVQRQLQFSDSIRGASHIADSGSNPATSV